MADLDARCRAIVERRLSYSLTSNGARLSKHLAWMQQAPPHTLWLSFHREYKSVADFTEVIRKGSDALPCIGVNLFDRDVVRWPDLIECSVNAGARRLKILHMTAIGRHRASAEQAPLRLNALARLSPPAGVELRLEAPLVDGVMTGVESCALKTRSLLSINHDGSVYPCCVTVGAVGAAIGDLRLEGLLDIIQRHDSLHRIACQSTLPGIASGIQACPLRLVQAPL